MCKFIKKLFGYSTKNMEIKYNNEIVEMNSEFSQKDFTHQTVELPNNINVYASCFSQEKVDTHVFPDDMTGVTFYNCNLDNCFIPLGNTVIGGKNRRFTVQNDGEDWVIDSQNKPVEPVTKKRFLQLGLSIDPKDIPKQKVVEAITSKSIEN